MTNPKNAAQAGVSVSEESAPLDLHRLYQQQAAGEYTRDLMLSRSTVQGITARLRGISAITAVLIAADDSEPLCLGAWLSAGLIEAVHALASDAHYDIERINNLAAKEGGAA